MRTSCSRPCFVAEHRYALVHVLRRTSPLGPATDTPATAIEVRAAEIASALRVTHRGWPSGEYEWPEGIAGTEPHGWLGHARDDDPIEPGPAYWSGYLARVRELREAFLGEKR